MNSTTLGRIKVGGICRFGSFGLSLSPREEVVSKNLLFLEFDESLSSLGRRLLSLFISRLIQVLYTLGGMYVLYVHMYLTILDRDREMLKCSDVI